MSDPVKPRRFYRSKLRMAQADDTRKRVLAAAHTKFCELGWTKTTIAAIAKAAHVSQETIYANFGSKSAILETVIRDAVRGESPTMRLMDQPAPQSIITATDPRDQIHQFSLDIIAVLSRVAPLIAVARTAAERDPVMRVLYLGLHTGRRKNLAILVEALARTGALREGLTKAAATDLVFRLVSPELYLLMRDVEGLSDLDISDWIQDTLLRVFSEPRPNLRPRRR